MTDKTVSRPIFILGSGRSGTSILTAALKSGAGISGFNEGHFLPLLHKLMVEVDRYFRAKERLRSNELHLVAHIDQARLEDEIICVFKRQCESMHSGNVWLDKSPTAGMIKTVPLLRRAWPEARYIFAKRRGIENIVSRLKKFPHTDFEIHCQQWAACMTEWLQVKGLVEDSCIEIDQREIALQPGRTARMLGEFLALDAEQLKRVEEDFIGKRPQSTGSAESEKAIDISQVGWTTNQIDLFRRYCADVSKAYGYTEGSNYTEAF